MLRTCLRDYRANDRGLIVLFCLFFSEVRLWAVHWVPFNAFQKTKIKPELQYDV